MVTKNKLSVALRVKLALLVSFRVALVLDSSRALPRVTWIFEARQLGSKKPLQHGASVNMSMDVHMDASKKLLRQRKERDSLLMVLCASG